MNTTYVARISVKVKFKYVPFMYASDKKDTKHKHNQVAE